MRKTHAGYTLIEMLVIIALSMLLLLLTSIMLRTSTQVIFAQHRVIPKIGQYDGLIDRIREDVWMSSQLSVEQSDTLELSTNLGAVRWQLDTDQDQILRVSPQGRRYFPAGLLKLHFEQLISGVLLTVEPNDSSQRAMQMHLMSRALLKEVQHENQ